MIDRRYGRSCAAVLLGAVCATAPARPAPAADGTPGVGSPIVLFSLSAPAHPASATARRSGSARAAIEAKPLIPPSALPTKLSPLPEPRPALSLETDLQPLPAPALPLPPAPPADVKPAAG